MVANPTGELEQHLKELHLPTMRQCYAEQATVATHDSWTYEQYLYEVVALEVDARRQNRVARYLRESRLPPEKSWDAFNRTRLPRKTTCNSMPCATGCSSTAMRTSSRSAIRGAGRRTSCALLARSSSIVGIGCSLRPAASWSRSSWWPSASCG